MGLYQSTQRTAPLRSATGRMIVPYTPPTLGQTVDVSVNATYLLAGAALLLFALWLKPHEQEFKRKRKAAKVTRLREQLKRAEVA